MRFCPSCGSCLTRLASPYKMGELFRLFCRRCHRVWTVAEPDVGTPTARAMSDGWLIVGKRERESKHRIWVEM